MSSVERIKVTDRPDLPKAAYKHGLLVTLVNIFVDFVFVLHSSGSFKFCSTL